MNFMERNNVKMKPTKKTYTPIVEPVCEVSAEVSAETVADTAALAETLVPDPPEPITEPIPTPEPLKMEAPVAPITPVAVPVAYVIEPALPEDYPWIAALWERYADVLGAGFEGIWQAYLAGREAGATMYHVDVCRPAEGFHFYTVLGSGHLLRRAIAVVNPRQGVGRALLTPLKGKVFTFCVQVDNTASIAFHNALGCPSSTALMDGVNNKLCMQYAGIFPCTPKALPPVKPEAPRPHIGEWRKG
jgi:hypothetical protein